MQIKKKRTQKNAFAVLFALLLLNACATPIQHSGRMGLLDRIEAGDSLTSSHASRSGGGSIAPVREEDLAKNPDPTAVLKLPGEWQWPLEKIQVNAPFGERGKKFHKGIDLHAVMGTSVFACADGKVIYVGSKIRGYGRMVVIKHAQNIFTVYAHHSKNLVKAGQTVKRGDLIARSGRSGHATGPHLHFEVRQGTISYDPMLVFNSYAKAHESVDRRFASESSPAPKARKIRRSKRSKRSAKVAHRKSKSNHQDSENI